MQMYEAMRWWCGVLCGLVLTACSSEYEGESFPRVVRASDVEIVDPVPQDSRVIGVVTHLEEAEVNGNSITERALWCDVEERLIRRMRRTAAREGGEFLVDVYCSTFEDEDDSPVHDDPDTAIVETSLHCETYCEAEVARLWAHD